MGLQHVSKNLTGKKFGHLTVLYYSHSKKSDKSRGRAMWECICKCGKNTTVPTDKLKSGHTRSCGCFHLKKVTKHAQSRTRFYRIWHAAKSRSLKQFGYEDIGFDERWNIFTNFYKDMHKSYQIHVLKYGEKNTTIDRIDTNGNYSKTNCRWATYSVQNNNFKKTKRYSWKNKFSTLSEIFELEKPPITRACFVRRITHYGYSIERALFTKNNIGDILVTWKEKK